MAQVPMRVAHQAGIVHQPRPTIMVSMQQPPPNTMTGMVSMSPMMAPSMVMTHGPPPPMGHQEIDPHHLAGHPQQYHPHPGHPAHPHPHPAHPHPHHPAVAPPLSAAVPAAELIQPPPAPPPAPAAQQQQQQAAGGQQQPAGAATAALAPAQTAASSGTDTASSAEGKEKTPMCLINELARYNKIQHQYRLTGEEGPAHKKTFTVILQLGEEEYQATGPSIKKAQHAAASTALEATKFKHPPPKQQRTNRTSLTPTVELNSLAMKRNETAMYTFIESPYVPHINYRGRFSRGVGYTPQYHRVCLRVGEREFYGVGPNPQAARHDSAAQALKVLRDLPLPGHAQGATVNGSDDPNAELKSPISLVHEIALKRSMCVSFSVTRETGPPHMRTFITQCYCGDLVTDGEGSSKKLSKKRAAEKMMDELKKLPALPAVQNITKVKRKPNATKKKSRNLIKVTPEEQKCSPDPHQGINPISRLIQIQQAKKEREPVYTLVDERGMARRREFVMSVTVNGHTCSGTGPNKKLAKRAAAEALLVALGYSRPQPAATKPALKQPDSGETQPDRNRRVTFQETDKSAGGGGGGGSAGRQLVPGLILMPGGGAAAGAKSSSPPAGTTADGVTKHQNTKHQGASGAETPPVAVKPPPPPAAATVSSVGPKEQLMYLANILGFQVQFTDIPRGNKSEFLSLVSLSTTPPQMSHGSGPTIEAAHNQAALTALTALTQMGLDNATGGGGGGGAAAPAPAADSAAEGEQRAGAAGTAGNGAAGDGPQVPTDVV